MIKNLNQVSLYELLPFDLKSQYDHLGGSNDDMVVSREYIDKVIELLRSLIKRSGDDTDKTNILGYSIGGLLLFGKEGKHLPDSNPSGVRAKIGHLFTELELPESATSMGYQKTKEHIISILYALSFDNPLPPKLFREITV